MAPVVLSIILLRGNISALTNFARMMAYGNLVGNEKLEGFDAPDKAGGPGFLRGERGAPEG